MWPAEVMRTSCRPTLTSEWLDPMPRHTRESSKNRNKPSHATERKKAPASLQQQLPKPSRAAEWGKAVRDGDREKIEALSRRGPDETPDKDTYTPIEDLQEGAPIIGPAAAARPPLTVWW